MPNVKSGEPQALGPRQGGRPRGQDKKIPDEGVPKGAGVNTGAGTTREKTEAEKEADRLYEEAIEDEYAKMEGGA